MKLHKGTMGISMPATDDLLARLLNHKLPEIELSLTRLRLFLERLGNPHHRLPSVVHVAGTNGKGSTIAYMRAMLEAGGYRCHVYTSPHLVRFHERIVVAGKDIKDAALNPLLARVEEASRDFPVTFFEATTAAAFLAFSQTQADIVLLEVGMGGRLDATNLIEKPALTVITSVSFDHMEFLGDTLAKIAYEKAGIIKQGVPCVIGPQQPEALEVLLKQARERSAKVMQFGRDFLLHNGVYESEGMRLEGIAPALPGAFQFQNAATAIACMQALAVTFPVPPEAILSGIAHAKWPARLQRLGEGALVALLHGRRECWLDGGHNPSAGEALAQWMQGRGEKFHAVIGMLKDKDAHGYLKPLAPYLKSLTVIEIPDEAKSMPLEQLLEVARSLGIEAKVADSPEEALQKVAQMHDALPVLIGGSLYLAGYILAKNHTMC